MPYCAEEVPSSFISVYAPLRVSLCFVLPFLIISVLYGKIASHLRRHHHCLERHDPRFHATVNKRKRITKMLLLMVALFFTCWIMLNINFLIMASSRSVEFLTSKYSDFYIFVMFLLIYIDCVCNPIVYTFMSSRFKRELKQMLCRGRSGDHSSMENSMAELDYSEFRRKSCNSELASSRRKSAQLC